MRKRRQMTSLPLLASAGMAALTKYGEAAGRAFQIADDLLDVTASAKTVGKATGKDAARMNRLFRQSRLVRPKWDREDYRNGTINEAIAGTAERFDIFARLPPPRFPGGTLLRWPGLVLGMLWFALRDRL